MQDEEMKAVEAPVPLFYGERVGTALAYAARLHSTQPRKGKPEEPYLSHILFVAGFVVRYGGSEDQIIAGALHDVAEDCGGRPRLAEIGELFGPHVMRIVEDCSDSLTEDPNAKPGWRSRKVAHLVHVRDHLDPDTPLVTACDKIANLTDLVDDFERDGEETLARFNGRAAGTRAYYAAMLHLLAPSLDPRVREDFKSLLVRLGGYAAGPPSDAVASFEEHTLFLLDK
jgi:(p)ppGpp synthase/HD superfamily hydrolase